MQGGFLLIGIIVLFFALWLVGGGPNRPISFQGPYLHPISTTATTAQAYGDSRTPGAPGVIGDWVGDTGTTILAADTSPSHGSVALSRSTAGPRTNDPRLEYVTIQVSGSASAPVDITGWRLVNSKGTAATIPPGTETLRSGVVNTTADILLSPGDEAIVTTGRSPVGGSFRENLCTGYLAQYQEFEPRLDELCPSPANELARFGPDEDDSCASAIRSVAYCEVPTGLSGVSRSCKNFADTHLAYNGCVDAHAKDAGFKERTWRIFLNAGAQLWDDDRESIRLVDASGKTVDVLTY